MSKLALQLCIVTLDRVLGVSDPPVRALAVGALGIAFVYFWLL